MRRFVAILSLLVVFIYAKPAKAQVSVNINIGSQPVWGPVGYNYVDYYYMPDIETYYYVPTRQFIYLNAGNWVFSASLPSRYRSYDLYHGYKVVINQPRPYIHHHDYRVKYSRYRGHHGQTAIRYSSNPRYYVVKGHPKYNQRPSRYDHQRYDHKQYNGRNDRGNSYGKGNKGNKGNGKGRGGHH